MKLRVVDRLLLALCGLLLLCCAAAGVAEAFFGVGVTELAGKLLSTTNTRLRWAMICGLLIILLLGLYCVSMLFRRSRKHAGFVEQKTEAGELAISMKALEGLVDKCVSQQDDVAVQSMSLENDRDGLTISLRAEMPEGINIPLVVNNLQKQIKQYVTSCSGVDVKAVRVQVDHATAQKTKSNYAVPLPSDVPAAEPLPKKDEKPFHQRIFTEPEQPQVIPVPPQTEEQGIQQKDVDMQSCQTETPAAAAETVPSETAQTNESERDPYEITGEMPPLLTPEDRDSLLNETENTDAHSDDIQPEEEPVLLQMMNDESGLEDHHPDGDEPDTEEKKHDAE